MSKPFTVVCVVGARPNFMKIAPIMRAFDQAESLIHGYLVHTGQHYDEAMKHRFFEQLGIPQPHIDLEVGSGSHAVQTAEVMKRFEPVLDQVRPDAVLVVGDVNSTIACALVAVKKGIPVIHVEAGLRSFDRAMPEEINRVLTDQISDVLFTTEQEAEANLAREGIAAERVHFVGNVMIDTLYHNLEQAVPAAQTLAGLEKASLFDGAARPFGILTLHRPSNVDDSSTLTTLLETITDISAMIPLVFPVHPRTLARIEAAGLKHRLEQANIAVSPPLGYLELLGLMRAATLVLTDSGGIQEETTALGVPCVTLRENTERPVTVTEGTNTVVGTDGARIRQVVSDILANGGKSGRIPALWDGKAALRISDTLAKWLSARRS